ncbi:hypothetical protein ACFYUJ_28755 [Streptomyces sp. NPDC004520]|uniref:hypothetical protein n=1 Tax=Streptomyces sp. NPDC004520 TaxID=3364702 RepID=UPI003693E091
MAASIIAVLGTLLGALVAGVLQHFFTLSARRDRDRQALTAAVAGLLGAATDHRRHQYLKHVVRRSGEDEGLELRVARYEAQSGVTKALTALMLATDDATLLRLANDVVDASGEIKEHAHDDRLAIDDAAERAHRAHAAFQSAAAVHLRR